MPLTRRKRIALELLGPAFIGAAPFIVALAGFSLWETFTKNQPWKFPLEALQGIGMILLVAYVCVGIQSILFTAILEWQFARGLDPRSWRAVGLSSLLGLASGAVVALAYGFKRDDQLGLWLFWGGFGLAVGFTLGLLIKWRSPKTASPTQSIPDDPNSIIA